MRKKLFAVVLSMTLAMSAVPVNAVTYSATSDGHSFSGYWAAYEINTATRTFVYGFNDWLIDEDFCHTYHANKKHTAYVKNTKRAQKKTKDAGKYSKVEITHSSGGIYYSYTY